MQPASFAVLHARSGTTALNVVTAAIGSEWRRQQAIARELVALRISRDARRHR